MSALRFRRTVALLAVGALALSSCLHAEAEADELQPVQFNPGWFPSAQFAGVFVAIDAGLMTEAGLAVTEGTFAYGQNSTALLQQDLTTPTLATIEGYILLQKLDRGDDLVALAPMLRESPAGVMSLAESNITSAADFAHQPIGVHAYADALFHWFATAAGGLSEDEINFVRVEDDIADLLSGHVVAMQGYASEEYVRLQSAAAPRETRFISFAALGFRSYSEILYTSRDQWEQHGPVLQRFVQAVRAGWELAYREPELAVKAVAQRRGPDADPEHIAAALQALRPYVLGDDGHALPPMDADLWRNLQTIASEIGLIQNTPADPTTWLAP
ncbi:ABC transporter substrate-binding protein [Actomonas aquatica]|uniref:ABC transporter substrate-binding protein n=1 Tax=Actomonas aquatica TaxID=2866162 RepID=A0ABZ1CB16_9BACT|nr:ABC transporter substrate-binding protein [Opitutus sp. WL0086]WRQ88889.1 ABC transporter substrate-binding protein [Opitutus sp. WL0086]